MIIALLSIISIITYVMIGICTGKFIIKSYLNGNPLLHETNIPDTGGGYSVIGDNIIASAEVEAMQWSIVWPIFWILLGFKMIINYMLFLPIEILHDYLTTYADNMSKNKQTK